MTDEGSGNQATESANPAPPAPRRFSGRAAPTETDGATTSGALVASSSRSSASKETAGPRKFTRQQVPDDILHNNSLNSAIKALPENYNFEVHKTVWRLRQAGAKRVALQFPEGLLLFACTLADIFETFCGLEECAILGDVTYGACCIDDFSAEALACDFLVHYGHSCLVPVDMTSIPCMYVFVEIQFSTSHLVDTIRHNFEPNTNITLAGTIQFATALRTVREELAPTYPALNVPQAKPLSPGEVLGCTAPVLGTPSSSSLPDAIVFVADGRFHLEAIMIANPSVPAYRYDPYGRVLTREEYDHADMRAVRQRMVTAAARARKFGLVLGTLGRQGNPAILAHLEELLASKGLPYTLVLISELSPAKIASLEGVEAWVQVACPRLSIDWGEGFLLPMLTPYEAEVALGGVAPWWEQGGGDDPALTPYPMNYYEKDAGPWTSSYAKSAPKQDPSLNPLHRRRARRAAAAAAAAPPATAAA